jgi:hypothetical protein
MSYNIQSTITPFIPIKRNCDGLHRHCVEIVNTVNKLNKQITQEYFNNFFALIINSRRSSCLSYYNNKNCSLIIKFIHTHSVYLKIPNWEPIISFMYDDDIIDIIKNQEKIDPNIIETLKTMEINQGYYGSKVNLLNLLITGTAKIRTFEHIIMKMNLSEFARYVEKIPKNYNSSIDRIINNFIKKNKKLLGSKENYSSGIKIFYAFISKPNLLKEIYPTISNFLNSKQRKVIFNKAITTYDKNLLLMILETKDVIPDMETIEKLVEKSYCRHEGASNSTQVAHIIDLLCEYGLVINKQIVMKLLEHGCYVNNFEKHGMVVDNEILAKCANLSYYPYKFDITPTSDILIKECSKRDNLNTIKKLKEFGGTYTTECLEEACGIGKNGRVIKYLINDCNVKISDKCLDIFQSTYRIDALDTLMKKYKTQNPLDKSKVNEEKHLEINEKSVMTVTPRNIKINIKDDSEEYVLKNKIRKFFEYKKKTIKYSELFKIFLKYLVTNKLVIGKYFVINIELSNLLKINHCVIMDTNQIHNILTYFIDQMVEKTIEGNSNTNKT